MLGPRTALHTNRRYFGGNFRSFLCIQESMAGSLELQDLGADRMIKVLLVGQTLPDRIGFYG